MRILPGRCHRWFLSLGLALALGWPDPALAAPAHRSLEIATAAPAAMRITGVHSAATDLEEAARAVVQIAAIGAFVDPQKGAKTSIHGGSGFIIDPSGIAVTNNHVVTGAAYLKVYLPGESKPRHAKVLGVDECADLAVIDIDGDHFPYLAWSDTASKVGTPVYAAGYPLGDPEYTLTSGIIGKAQANGQTQWASLDYTLQHDATLNPGNSGGPLLDSNGRVVGINYAGDDDANQYFAISRDLARPLIEQLRTGLNLDTIGVNGQALSDGKTFAGVWVASVRSGSPADQTGVQPGDFIVEMEGVLVGNGGTLESYCNILRSHNPKDAIAIKVWRGQGEVWAGQLNGRPLQLVKPAGTPTATEEPTPTQPDTTPPPAPTTTGMNPTLVKAVTAVGWNPANGQFQSPPDEVITATFQKGGSQLWSYSLVSGVQEYAIYYQVALGGNGHYCSLSLGEVVPKPSYSHRGLSFQLTSEGTVGRFFLQEWNWWGGADGQSKDFNAQASDLIHTGKGQFNEVIITVQGKTITVYMNGTQVMQHTDTGFLETGALSLMAWANTIDPQTPHCVFRDVQWFVPN